jgi:hypothetical protein
MQPIGTLDQAFAWLDSVGGELTMSTNAVECRAPGAWHCVKAEAVTLPGIRILVAVNSVHEQVVTRKNAALNRRRGHGAKASHEWAKKGERG